MLSNVRVYLVILFGIYGVIADSTNCKSNSDCTENFICKNSACVCDEISYGEKCYSYVTEFNSYCQENEQCEWLGNNSACIKNVCVCDKSYSWYKGKCTKFAKKDEHCDEKLNCYDNNDPLSLKCENNKCVCNDGYYDRGNDCRKISDQTCAIDMDCNSDKLFCAIGKCVQKTTLLESEINNNKIYEETEELFIYKNDRNEDASNISCVYDSDCKDMKNSVCDQLSNKCRCSNEYSFIYEGNCLPGFKHCDANKSCDVPNTICFHNVCVCKQGFFYSQGQCLAELGMPDKSNNCTIKPTKRKDDTCYCIDYWFPDYTNRNCIKTTLQKNKFCLTNDWCNAMGPHSYCDVTNNQCQCRDYAVFNSKTFYCDPNTPNGGCSRDVDCPYNEECVNQNCHCINNFSRNKQGICQPDLGGQCDLQLCSYIENSKCREGICRCNPNYLDHDKKCLKIAETWGDPCEITEQCQNFKFAECNTNSSKCTCSNGYRSIEGTCWKTKEYGDPCMTQKDCTIVLNKYYQCRNSKCLCPIGQTLENGYCIMSSSNQLQIPLILIISLLTLIFIQW